MSSMLTHEILVKIARRWLLGTRRCRPVQVEAYGCNGEIADALGWTVGHSANDQFIVTEGGYRVAWAARDKIMNEYRRPEGFSRLPLSHLVECKTSVADFRADRSKRFRKAPELGMGAFRWFLIPSGALAEAELEGIPPAWGLAVVRGARVHVVRKPLLQPRHWNAEFTCLLRDLRLLDMMAHGRGADEDPPMETERLVRMRELCALALDRTPLPDLELGSGEYEGAGI